MCYIDKGEHAELERDDLRTRPHPVRLHRRLHGRVRRPSGGEATAPARRRLQDDLQAGHLHIGRHLSQQHVGHQAALLHLQLHQDEGLSELLRQRRQIEITVSDIRNKYDNIYSIFVFCLHTNVMHSNNLSAVLFRY